MIKTALLTILAGLPLLAGSAPAPSAPAPDGACPLAVVIEDSSTIPAVEFERAKTQLLLVTTRLPERYHAGLYAGGQPPLLISDYGPGRGGLRDQLAGLLRRGASPGGLATLQMAWGHGSALHPGAGGAILFATDGRGLDAQQLAGLGQQLAGSRWRLFALGIGYPEEAGLKQLAEATGGRYAPLSPAALDNVVAALGDNPGAQLNAAPARASTLQSSGDGSRLWMIIAATLLLVVVALAAAFVLRRPAQEGARARRPKRNPDDAPTQVISTAERAAMPARCALLGKAGPKRGMTISIDPDKGLVMGRSRSCDLIIADGTLSAQHLKISLRKGRYFVNDLQSTNGTFVNGERVDSAELRPGDLLRLGNSEFQLKAQKEGEKAS